MRYWLIETSPFYIAFHHVVPFFINVIQREKGRIMKKGIKKLQQNWRNKLKHIWLDSTNFLAPFITEVTNTHVKKDTSRMLCIIFGQAPRDKCFKISTNPQESKDKTDKTFCIS